MKASLYKVGKKTENNYGYRIVIPQSQSLAFFELIGKSPIQSLAFKWK